MDMRWALPAAAHKAAGRLAGIAIARTLHPLRAALAGPTASRSWAMVEHDTVALLITCAAVHNQLTKRFVCKCAEICCRCRGGGADVALWPCYRCGTTYEYCV